MTTQFPAAAVEVKMTNQDEHILTATAIDVNRLFAWYEGVPLARTRISSFAKLAPD